MSPSYSLLTLRRADEETSHAESSDQALHGPNKRVTTLVTIFIVADDAQNERAQGDKYRAGDEEVSDIACVEEATNDDREQKDNE